jgi:hypothetical protein
VPGRKPGRPREREQNHEADHDGNPVAAVGEESRQLVSDLFHQLSQPPTTLCCSLELAYSSPPAEQCSEGGESVSAGDSYAGTV